MNLTKRGITSFKKKTSAKKIRLLHTYADNEAGEHLKLLHTEMSPSLYRAYEFKTNGCSFAYTKGIGVIDCVNQHIKANYIFKCDIKGFFDNLTHSLLIKKLEKMGISNAEFVVYSAAVNYKGVAQGLKISDKLANIYLLDFDERMKKYCDLAGMVYTRYSDDIFISSEKIFSKETINFIVENNLYLEDLELKKVKTDLVKLTEHRNHIKMLGMSIVCGKNGKNFIKTSRKYDKITKKVVKDIAVFEGRENFKKMVIMQCEKDFSVIK